MNWGTFGWLYAINRKHGLGIANNWLYARGRHTLNFGMEIRRTFQDDQECQRCAGNLSFDARTTADPVNDPGGYHHWQRVRQFPARQRRQRRAFECTDDQAAQFLYRPLFSGQYKNHSALYLESWAPLGPGISVLQRQQRQSAGFLRSTKPNLHAINPATGQPRLGAMSILGKDVETVRDGTTPICSGGTSALVWDSHIS